jgi:hypothetical protein
MGLTNYFIGKSQDRSGRIPDLIVFHKVINTFSNMLKAYPNSDKSVNFIINKDGNIGGIIPIAKAGYLCETSINKTLLTYYARAKNSVVRSRKLDANLYAISIDVVVDNMTDGITYDQKQSCIWLINHIRNTIQNSYNILIPLNTNYITGYDQILPSISDSLNNPGDSFPYNEFINALNPTKNSVIGGSNNNYNALRVGTKVTLNNIKLYSTATSPSIKEVISGTYYLYDGILLGNRYAITQFAECVKAVPTSSYIKGYIYADDVLVSNPIIPTLANVDYTKTPSQSISSISVNLGSSGSVVSAGLKVKLDNTAIYNSPTDKDPYTYKTGVFYLYDGISNNNRYRITNSITNVGKTPIGDYTVGFIDDNVI